MPAAGADVVYHLSATVVGAVEWPNYIPGDFNQDGEVGPEDFAALKDHFGVTGGPKHPLSSVPEPASLVALLGLALPMLRKRKVKA